MGLIRTLLGYQDPARKWQLFSGQPLTFDFDTNSLNGVGLQAAWTGLSAFGPPSLKRRSEDDSLVYLERGFSVDLSAGRVENFSFVWIDYLRQGFQPFKGEFIRKGKRMGLNAETDEASLLAGFGEPYWRDEAKDEIILFYEVNGAEWQFELNAAGHLKTLLVLTVPILSDETQRDAYQVTKPWPPRK